MFYSIHLLQTFVHERSKCQLFEHFKPLNGSFSVASLYILTKPIFLELPFHAELNGVCTNSIIKVSVSYDLIIKYM